jgi:hypothetical protein
VFYIDESDEEMSESLFIDFLSSSFLFPFFLVERNEAEERKKIQ